MECKSNKNEGKEAYKNEEAFALNAKASVKGGRRTTFPRFTAVSSSRQGLTSLFGMGRGAPLRHSRLVSLRPRPDREGKRRPRDDARTVRPALGSRRRGGWARAPLRDAAQALGPLVPLGSTCRHAHTCGLSTWSSATALHGGLISGQVSRLDAFSAYLLRTRLPGGASGDATGAP